MRGLFIGISGPLLSRAWWDEGHMMVAAVAKVALENPSLGTETELLPWTQADGNKVVQKVERLLGAWSDEYPHLSSLISSAAWADHIKCRSASPQCMYDKYSDGIELFNHWHYASLDVNRPFSGQLSEAKTRPGNAVWFLSQSLEELRGGDTEANAAPDVEDKGTKVPTSLRPRGFLADNLLIRFFIHIFGDALQPLHIASRSSSTCHPSGDRGANAIPVVITEDLGTNVTNLHQLWDCGAGAFSRPFSPATMDSLKERAFRLAVRHRPEKVLSSPLTLLELFESSFNLSASIVYSEVEDETPRVSRPALDDLAVHANFARKLSGEFAGAMFWFQPESPACKAFHPSPAYVQMVRDLSEKRVTEGGFSLAFYLREFASRIPDDLVNSTQNLTTLKRHLDFWRAVAISASLCLLVTFTCAALPRKSRNGISGRYGSLDD